MAWYVEMIPILRSLIDDVSKTEYTDERLKELLAIAAYQVIPEIKFSTTYSVTIVPPLVSPDPTASSDGNILTNFVTLKAACIIDRAPLRKRTLMSGLEAKCGPAVMKTLQHVSGFRELLKLGYCGVYDTTREQYLLGNVNFCKAVLSPFISSEFCPEDLLLHSNRHFNHNEFRI